MTPNGYVEGFRSLAVDQGPMSFIGYPSNLQALGEADSLPTVQRLAWFNHGFQQARVVDGELVLSDLRMGNEPQYFFRFAVAGKSADGWQPIPPRQLASPVDAAAIWRAVWRRMWHQPEMNQAAADSPVDTPATSASK